MVVPAAVVVVLDFQFPAVPVIPHQRHQAKAIMVAECLAILMAAAAEVELLLLALQCPLVLTTVVMVAQVPHRPSQVLQ
jgi:hypothetical protein